MVSDNPLDDITDEFDNPDHPVRNDLSDPLEILRKQRERAPQWLRPQTRCSRTLLKQFLSRARMSFYPGAGEDGQLFSVLGKSGSVHCHVHADYSVPPTAILSALEATGDGRVYGYDVISHTKFPSSWLSPFEQPPGCDWAAHDPREEPPGADWNSRRDTGLIAVLRRQDRFAEDHGPEFQCLLHVQADAYWLYWNLWAKHGRAPYAVVLQEHGFGGNHPGESFGGTESQLFQMASQAGLPEFLLVGENTHSWPGYDVVAGRAPGTGQHNLRRCLYGKVEAANTNPEDAITRY